MKTHAEIEMFIREHGANPYFWLNALQTHMHTPESRFRDNALTNSHEKLKMFVDFIMEK